MTIKEAADLYGVTPQAIYKRLAKSGHDVKTLKTGNGALTEEGISLIERLFDRITVTGDGEDPSAPRQENAGKQAGAPSLQGKREVERLKKEVENQLAEINRLKAEVESLRDERDYLRHALDQAQQLHAMALNRMLPPAEATRKPLSQRLFGLFEKKKKEDDNHE